jgi:3,4-dihydroxy 2-butanone 4-phosphate synthase/GTP cyclohydrolase II
VYLRQEKDASVADAVRAYARGEGAGEPGDPGPSAGQPDLRIYGIGAQILKQLGAGKIRLITSHPRKIVGLQGFGLTVIEQVPLCAFEP